MTQCRNKDTLTSTTLWIVRDGLVIKYDSWTELCWLEAVKKEIAGWDDNRAVELVNIEDVPASAKIIPLGELYTIKRNGTYKFRQY
jgi:hypothetical protein